CTNRNRACPGRRPMGRVHYTVVLACGACTFLWTLTSGSFGETVRGRATVRGAEKADGETAEGQRGSAAVPQGGVRGGVLSRASGRTFLADQGSGGMDGPERGGRGGRDSACRRNSRVRGRDRCAAVGSVHRLGCRPAEGRQSGPWLGLGGRSRSSEHRE